MSKPLIFIMQLAGLVLVFMSQYGRPELLVIGLILVVIGGIGFRKRVKQEKKKSSDMAELLELMKNRE